MTSISSSAAAQHASPKQKLLSSLASAVSAGTIPSSDTDALTSAIDDIDTSLQQRGSASGGQRLDPAGAKSKIDDLISGEVSSGKLTEDQAKELKQLFEANKPQDGAGGAGGSGGVHGHHHGSKPPSAAAADSTTDSTTSSDTSSSGTLADFLKQLQSAQSSSASYGAGGTTSAQSLVDALVVDYKV